MPAAKRVAKPKAEPKPKRDFKCDSLDWQFSGRRVADEGKASAKIVLIGEAPGNMEDREGRPFIGPSGNKLYDWWDHEDCQLRRLDMYITNVVPYRPRDNKVSSVPAKQIKAFEAELRDRISSLDGPHVLVPTGNVALHALTNRRLITKNRGSILPFTDNNGRVIKVVPTIHPAFTLYEKKAKWDRICQMDWIRVAHEASFPELFTPVRKHIIYPTQETIKAWVAEMEVAYALDPEGTALSIDIETPGGRINCVGFSFRADQAICIPVAGTSDPNWDWIKRLCAHPIAKVFQNGLFDNFYLRFAGVPVRNWYWDTLAMHHCLDSTLPHSLDFMASVDTREPYWKDEAKDPEEIAKYADNEEAFYTYNCKDAAVTHELWALYRQRLESRGLRDFYVSHYRRMFRPLLSIMCNGIRVDKAKRRSLFAEHRAEVQGIKEYLNREAGFDLYGPKGSIVPGRLQKFLYEKLGLPRQYNRKARTRTAAGGLPTTTDGTAIRRLQLRVGKRHAATPILDAILRNRIHDKQSGFLKDEQIDADSKFRCSYRFTTETGRLSSAKNPWRTGGNLQNIDRRIRHTFLPDEDGWVFLEADLSQAEDRVVKMLTGNEALIDLALKTPWEFDAHSFNASQIFSVEMAKVTKELRDVGKVARHAGNYGMGPETLSDNLLKAGYVRTLEECADLLRLVFKGDNQDILKWQMETRKTIIRDRVLVNSWGRQLDLSHFKMNDDLYRRGYAFIPQSEVADILNQWGLIPVHRFIRDQKLHSRLNAQVHDSVLISCPPAEVWPLMQVLRSSLERPRLYHGLPMTIWATFKIGNTWKGDHEWKKFPEQAEVEAKVQEVLSG